MCVPAKFEHFINNLVLCTCRHTHEANSRKEFANTVTIAVCFVSEPIILLTLSVGVNNDKFYCTVRNFNCTKIRKTMQKATHTNHKFLNNLY